MLKEVSAPLIQLAVAAHQKERHAHGFRCRDHFIAMLFCQLGPAKSLREIKEGLMASEGQLRHLDSRTFSMRRLPLSTENVTAGMAFCFFAARLVAFAQGTAVVKAARVLHAVRATLTGALVSCDLNTFEAKAPDIHDCFISPKSLGCLVLLSAALKRRRIVGIIFAVVG